MSKVILLTGATDGIGLVTAEKLVSQGHRVLIHGRNAEKLKTVEQQLKALNKGDVKSYLADFSDIMDIKTLADNIKNQHAHIDIIINNAGVYKTNSPITKDNLDVRFVVNTITPYLLTKLLLPVINSTGRVINLSSAAQAPVDLDALAGKHHINDQFSVYGQSKLGIAMWSRQLAKTLGDDGPVIIAVNPGSLLASKMVKEGFGVEGKDINIGADILIQLATSDEFQQASGLYFDNDIGQLSNPHSDALDNDKCEQLVTAIESLLNQFGININQ